MPPKKKQKAGRNGFYYFMLEIQKEEIQSGNRCTLAEISEIASPMWTAMTPEERKPYNNMAQTGAAKSNEDLTKKFTSLGISYAELDAEQREFEEAQNLMLGTIINTIANLNIRSTLKTHIFFVCHANYFYKTDHQDYYPAEIALAAFSLEFGVLATLHFFVDPGEIPLGYKFEAADWSNRTHGIPICDSSWNEGIKQPLEMYRRVKDFIKKFANDVEVPPIYTMFDIQSANNRSSVVKSALSMMCEAANEDSSLFRVYCLSHLFFEIRNKCSAEIPSVAIMKSELEKDVFSYARDLGCYYHEEKDLSIHCSLSIVTRWVFTICDHCCKHLGIKLILGRHVPKDTDLSESAVYIENIFDSLEDSNIAQKHPSRTLELIRKDKNLLQKHDTADSFYKPLTIIDHGRLKEQRAEQRRVQDVHLQESEKIRLPKSSYSHKIGARFNLDTEPSTSHGIAEAKEQSNEDGWVKVKGKSSGRGRGIFRDPSPEQLFWPVSGRGRAFSNPNM